MDRRAATHLEQRRAAGEPGSVGINDAEPTTFDPAYKRLSASLPEHTALLCVTVDKDGLFKAHWFFGDFHDESRPGDIPFQRKPDFTLADILATKDFENSYFKVMTWWDDKRRLNEWIDSLLAARVEPEAGRPRLIIWDNTGYQIPWELYFSDAKARWLGASIEVVRWTSIKATDRIATYTATMARCEGRVLALETEDVGNHGPILDNVLARYQCVPVREMSDLLLALDDSANRFGLVVVRCHGLYGTSADSFELGGMKMTHYAEHRMESLAVSPAVVLLNACHTAATTSLAGGSALTATRSFAELFLRRGATSVVAAFGEIGLDESHSIMIKLLYAAEREQRIGTFLLNQRAAATQDVADPAHTRTAAQFEAFFQSYAYVYFGHPDTTLRLSVRPTQVTR